jgi:hypothetical protein
MELDACMSSDTQVGPVWRVGTAAGGTWKHLGDCVCRCIKVHSGCQLTGPGSIPMARSFSLLNINSYVIIKGESC